MSDYGFIRIPRSLLRDFEAEELSLEYRHIFLTILDHMAFKAVEMNNSGEKIIVQPFQLLASENTIREWCNEGIKKKENQISESMIHRALVKFENLGWIYRKNFKKTDENQKGQKSNQLSNQKKSLLTISRQDILNICEPVIEPVANQSRTSREPQKKKEKKEREINKNIKEENLLKCSHVHNSSSSEHSEHLDESAFFIKIRDSLFNLAAYRFPDNSSLSANAVRAYGKYTDANQERLLRNWILCEERWANGMKPKDGNYEKMLQGYFKQDIAKKKENVEKNILFAKYVKEVYDLYSLKIMKTVVKFNGDSISLEEDPEIFSHRLNMNLKELNLEPIGV